MRLAPLLFLALASCAMPDARSVGPDLACPTPSDARIESPSALTGRDLLASSDYFTLMIRHGSMESLEGNLRAAIARNPGIADPADVARLEAAIAFRRANACPDVPFYVPYVTDTPIDGLDPGLLPAPPA